MAISDNRLSVSGAGKDARFKSDFLSASETSKFTSKKTTAKLFKEDKSLKNKKPLKLDDPANVAKLSKKLGSMKFTKSLNSKQRDGLSKAVTKSLVKSKSKLGASIGSKKLIDALYGDCPDILSNANNEAFLDALLIALALGILCSPGLISELLSANGIAGALTAIAHSVGKIMGNSGLGKKASNLLADVNENSVTLGLAKTDQFMSSTSKLIGKSDLMDFKSPTESYSMINDAIGSDNTKTNNSVINGISKRISKSKMPSILGDSVSKVKTSDIRSITKRVKGLF